MITAIVYFSDILLLAGDASRWVYVLPILLDGALVSRISRD